VPVKWFIEHRPEIYPVPVKTDVPADFPYEKLGLTGYKWFVGRHPVPIYEPYDGKILWGLTGIITDNLIKIICGEKR
jgi:hypothetical protein